MSTYAERAPDTKFALIADSSGNAIASSNPDCTESLRNKGFKRMWDSSKVVDAEERFRVIRIRNILGNTS
jgi:hypothetical protein